MPEVTLILVLVVLFAIAFDYINGFHDTANAIATVVSTRVLTPRAAIAMAAVLNFVGALYATGVAKTIAKGLVDPSQATQLVVLSALIGAIIWNLITWFYGIPSSSSHALIGGLVGAAIAHGGSAIVLWNGLTQKVLIPIVASPVGGFLIGWSIIKVIHITLANAHPRRVSRTFRTLQMLSAASMAYSHGSNDAQKSMGIITLALMSSGFLSKADIPPWVVFVCALAMAAGTAGGGWRIIKTMGHKIIRLEPVHGFAAETSASCVILLADHFHAPISTTQVISGSIFGVGAGKRFSAVRWGVAQRMVVAWILTLPAAGAAGALCYILLKSAGVR
jgi:PiT family inorganic phosphate transporter